MILEDRIRALEIANRRHWFFWFCLLCVAIGAGLLGATRQYEGEVIRGGLQLRDDQDNVLFQVGSNGNTLVARNLSVNGSLTVADWDKLPVGTVIGSVFPWDVLANELNPSAATNWLPADGRPAPQGSSYARICARSWTANAANHPLFTKEPGKTTFISSLPDLRGVFLRGLNSFDPVLGVRKVDTGDPDGAGRVPGSWQNDVLRSHHHDNPHAHLEAQGGHGFDGWGFHTNSSAASPPDCTTTPPLEAYAKGKETRPRNVAVYYYIKIN